MVKKLNPNSTIPLHQQAENLLRRMIASDEYKDGKLLPNEVDLSKDLGISRNTLRQAINKLTFEGLLIRKKGYGTAVAPLNVLSNARNWMSFSQEMQAMGMEVQNFELHVSWKIPPEEVIDFFSMKKGEKALCLERLRGRPGKPFVFFVSFFNPQIPMTGNEDMSKPLYGILKDKYGVEVNTSREMISARATPSDLAEKFDCATGDPMLVRKRFVCDINNKAVEYNIGYYRADSFIYSIEFNNQ